MKTLQRVGFAVVAIASGLVYAQTQIDLRSQSKTVDFSSALSTKYSRTGTTLSPVCSVGETFFKINAPAGQNLYGCTAVNAWTVLAGSSSSTNATQLQSRSVASTAPTDGQGVIWNAAGNMWQPGTASSSSNATQLQSRNLASTAPADGQGVVWSAAGNTWQPGTASSSSNATQLQSRNFASTAPADGQGVVWNAAGNTWQPATLAAGVGANFGRFNISATGTTSLSFGTDCATYNCNAGPIDNPTTFVAPMTISSVTGASSATIGVDLSVSPARGKVVLDAGSASVIGMSGIAVVGAVPSNMFVLYTCSIGSGTFANCIDKRGSTVAPPVTGHNGVVCTTVAGATDCVIDSAQSPTLSAVPLSATAACSPPQFAADTSFYYICVAVNTWRRAGVSSF